MAQLPDQTGEADFDAGAGTYDQSGGFDVSDDGGQSLTTPPEDITDADVHQAMDDQLAQSDTDQGMHYTYDAMDTQYGMDLS